MSLSPVSLVTPQDIDNFLAKLSRLKDTRDLASRLIVAADGQTYLLNDIEALSDAEIANDEVLSNLTFITSQGYKRSLKDLRSSSDLRNFIHNKPLTTYLSKIQSSSFLNLPVKNCPLTESPIVFPAITNIEDLFEYDAVVDIIATRKRHPISNETPYTHEQALPNIALGQLFKLNYYQLKARNLITAEQTKSIVEICHLRLTKATNTQNDFVSNDALYKTVVAKDPTLKTKTMIELVRMTNHIAQEKKILEVANAKLQTYVTTTISIAAFGLSIAAIVTPSVFLTPVGFIIGSIGILATVGGFIGKGIINLYYKNKLTDLKNRTA